MELPRLVVLNLYRDSLSVIEKLARSRRDKKVHAWAVKARKDVGELMMQCAADEMEDVSEGSEPEKPKNEDEEFFGI